MIDWYSCASSTGSRLTAQLLGLLWSGCTQHVLFLLRALLQVLGCNTDEPSAGDTVDIDLPAQVASFGRRYVASDSTTALHYYMLASALAGGGVREQGRLFRELLVHSKDYGKCLCSAAVKVGRRAAAQTAYVPQAPFLQTQLSLAVYITAAHAWYGMVVIQHIACGVQDLRQERQTLAHSTCTV